MSEGDPSWLDRTLFPFTSRFVEVGGHNVHYIDEGSGPVLLLLHGNPTWSFLYRHLVLRLSAHFRCVALDYPGFGLSTAAPGYGYTPREHSIVLEGVVEALDLTDLTMMVQDWDGPIGLGIACSATIRMRKRDKQDEDREGLRRRRASPEADAAPRDGASLTGRAADDHGRSGIPGFLASRGSR